MDVIGFLCVSLCSRTVQFHESLGSRRAWARPVVIMATVLEVCTTEDQSSVALFCGQKNSMKRIFTKKYFLFTFGSVCRVKRFTTGSRKVENISLMMKRLKRRCGIGWHNSQKLLFCTFRRTGKAMGKVFQCWRRICREINVFPRFEYHIFYVLYQLVNYLLTLRRRSSAILRFVKSMRLR
jgi:hypothetical protein